MSADRYLAVDGARLRYRDEGNGTAVILVHGWTLDLDMWEPQARALQERFRVIRFDRRGFGLSSGQPSLNGDIDDIDALALGLDVSRFALLGMSQGARPCLQFALARQESLGCLILDGCPPVLGEPGPPEILPLIAHYRELVATQGMAAFLSTWKAHPLMQLRTDVLLHRELLDKIISRYPGNDLMQADTDKARDVSAENLRGLGVPVLLMTGEHELPERTEVANTLASLMPNAQRAITPRAGHLSNLDNSGQYNEILLCFLQQHRVG